MANACDMYYLWCYLPTRAPLEPGMIIAVPTPCGSVAALIYGPLVSTLVAAWSGTASGIVRSQSLSSGFLSLRFEYSKVVGLVALFLEPRLACNNLSYKRALLYSQALCCLSWCKSRVRDPKKLEKILEKFSVCREELPKSCVIILRRSIGDIKNVI